MWRIYETRVIVGHCWKYKMCDNYVIWIGWRRQFWSLSFYFNCIFIHNYESWWWQIQGSNTIKTISNHQNLKALPLVVPQLETIIWHPPNGQGNIRPLLLSSQHMPGRGRVGVRAAPTGYRSSDGDKSQYRTLSHAAQYHEIWIPIHKLICSSNNRSHKNIQIKQRNANQIPPHPSTTPPPTALEHFYSSTNE